MSEYTPTTQSTDGPYVYDHEPLAQGGARYVRCELCGREVIPADPRRLLHTSDCPEADR